MKYDFAAIEKKWQDKWAQVKPYAAVTGDMCSALQILKAKTDARL